ncbi:MAG: 2-oxoacid:acceptor oxidoreductase family protein, partial [Microvirgula sp.]
QAGSDALELRYSDAAEGPAVADWLRSERQLRVGVVGITLFRPFAGDLLGEVIKGCKGVAVLERTDQPLAEDLPLMREVRATLGKCLENGRTARGKPQPYPGYAAMAASEAPDLYSGVYGLGSRDLQPACLIGAVENMRPDSSQRRFFYLGIDFISEPLSPVEAECNDRLLDAYPQVRELAVKGSVNPDLMPPDALTIRIHSIGGWGAITTGKNLAMTLFELLDWEIRANPKYGSEKKGQPTTYYLAAAPTPIRLNCEYRYVDVVMSPDPNVFSHSNPLDGLKPGGVFILQADSPDPDTVWAGIPAARQQEIVERGIRLFFVDGFSIARDEASHPELQLRMQGNAFQGAFF